MTAWFVAAALAWLAIGANLMGQLWRRGRIEPCRSREDRWATLACVLSWPLWCRAVWR